MQSKTVEPEPQPTSITLVDEVDARITYANYAKVQVTSFEGVITFALIDPATALGGQGEIAETVSAPAVARIALPLAVLRPLVDAISAQLEKKGE